MIIDIICRLIGASLWCIILVIAAIFSTPFAIIEFIHRNISGDNHNKTVWED